MVLKEVIIRILFRFKFNAKKHVFLFYTLINGILLSKYNFFFIILTQIIDEKPNTCLFGQKPLNGGL